MLSGLLILFCNIQLPTSPCRQQIIQTHEGGPQGQGGFSSLDLWEESDDNVGAASGTPRPTAAGRELQAPCTGAEQDTAPPTRHLEGGRDSICHQQAVGTEEEAYSAAV